MTFPMTLTIGDTVINIPINNTNTKANRNLDTNYSDKEWMEFHISEALGLNAKWDIIPY